MASSSAASPAAAPAAAAATSGADGGSSSAAPATSAAAPASSDDAPAPPSSAELSSALSLLAQLSSLLGNDSNALPVADGLSHVLPSLLAPLAPLPSQTAPGLVAMPVSLPPPAGAPNAPSGVSLLSLPPAQAALLARRAAFRPRDALAKAQELQRLLETQEAQNAVRLVQQLRQKQSPTEQKEELLRARKERAQRRGWSNAPQA